jgi:putative ABC transport system substrate-binding protein
MRRRTFIAGLGSAAAWPLAAYAQQRDRVRRIGVLAPYDENDPEGKVRYSAFTQALADLGWTDGRNVRMDLRWGGGAGPAQQSHHLIGGRDGATIACRQAMGGRRGRRPA